MTERERVLAAVAHKEPDICPCSVNKIDDKEFFMQAYGVDSVDGIRAHLTCDVRKNEYREHFRCEPGLSIWGASDDWDAGYSVARGGYPLAGVENVHEVDAYPWPGTDVIDYAAIRRDIEAFDSRFSRVLSIGSLLSLHTLMDMFGMEDTLVGLHLDEPAILAALAHITEFHCASVKCALEACSDLCDFMWVGEDFATQRGMMMSPEVWRRHLKPVYARVFSIIKSYGLGVWFHSCGTFRPVMGDLIDIGMDVWETVQAHLEGNEPEVLKAEYGKHITFYGGVSSQSTLPFGTPEDVRKEVRERFRVLGKGGGYIIGGDHSFQKNMPPENIFALFDEVKKCAYN